VVLINRGSASASEILASALKEQKRALVIGSRSWGKGLVQTISHLSLNTAVALTTAKYYTPDDKCLQRDFGKLDDYYFFLNTSDDDYETNTQTEGGVIPDIYIKNTGYPPILVNFISKGIFFKFARHLLDEKTLVTRRFKADTKIISLFKSFLKQQEIDYEADAFQEKESQICTEIEREVLNQKFSYEDGIQVTLEADPVARRAVEELKKIIFPQEKN